MPSTSLFSVRLICCVIISLALLGPATTGFGQTEAPLKLPTDFFPILPWDPLYGWHPSQSADQGPGAESIAECGFTLAGFVQPKDLPLCERLGLRAIVFPGVANSGAWSRQWSHLSADEIDARIRQIVKEAGSSKAVIGYFLRDEPGAQDFAGLARAVAAVRKYAPGKLAYINLFPNYATVGAKDKSQLGTPTYTDYLEQYVREVKPQFLSYDNYMTQVSMDLTDPAKSALYFTNLLEVRRVAQEHQLPFWNIVSANQIRPHTTVPSPANLLMQAYTTLAAGGRGVSWFTYYSDGYGYAPIDQAGHYTPSWMYLQMVNRQLKIIGPMMNGLTSTGVYFTAAVPDKTLPRLPGRIVTDVGTQSPIMVGEFTGEDGADYVMVVNLDLQQSVRLQLKTAKTYKQRALISPVSGEPLPLNDQNDLAVNSGRRPPAQRGLWLVAGQGALLRFAP